MSTESGSERTEPPQTRFRPSCLQCQRLKKKCDRQRPQCSLCLRYEFSNQRYRHGRICSYDSRNSSSGDAESGVLGFPDQSIDSHQAPEQPFPAVFFLDSALFKRSVSKLPDQSFSLNPDLLSFVGNVAEDKAFVSSYFTYIHPWIPFMSKKLFMERVLNPLSPAKPEKTLLVAAVRLLASPPSGQEAQTAAYLSIKAALLRADRSGVLNFKIFQVMILVAIYEIGHAIYPAAYLTTGICSRYGSALGLSKTVESFDAFEENQSLMEAEEKRRSWWAAVILDRFISLGSGSILPMDDALWEQGGHVERPMHRLSSPPTETMGRYGLTAQAAVLLGRVFQNIHDTSAMEGFQESEARILDSTLIALTNVSFQEGRFRGIGVCSPTTICFSARLLLHDESRYPSTRHRAISDPLTRINIEADIAAHMLRLADSVSGTRRCGIEEISPFCLEPMYRSGIVYARRYSETGQQEDQQAFETIKQGLRAMAGRWKAADAYVDLLEARELTGIL
ncbi:hypothetical protein B0J15DRAFT_533763 [Fusarium solani]|uniref:Zn(2)-C6 fungal-type domain-containing protein n=1 Tax=Fusarium solani TaxID=169388 RepID=A0A9P9KTQ3_FUSSL|nr:uncharacterized protein B0J15DRAFT_533763 [Fusarium solani]KAH7268302.1 hypothetical protein B0J15DRAFT_533763 [Fusarium solani]